MQVFPTRTVKRRRDKSVVMRVSAIELWRGTDMPRLIAAVAGSMLLTLPLAYAQGDAPVKSEQTLHTPEQINTHTLRAAGLRLHHIQNIFADLDFSPWQITLSFQRVSLSFSGLGRGSNSRPTTVQRLYYTGKVKLQNKTSVHLFESVVHYST